MPVYVGSRYSRNTVYRRKGLDERFLNFRERFTFNEQECKVHIWMEGDTLDGLAVKYYGNSALRWAILDANIKYRTEFDIEPGDSILIPQKSEVLEIINV